MTAPASGPAGATPAETRCYRHPNREALVRCTRCDRPICPDCMRPASVGFLCPDDVAMAARGQRAPRTTVGARLRQSPPWITGLFVGLNVVVYLVTAAQSSGGWNNPGVSRLFLDWQMFPRYVHDKDQYYRLLTSAFLHVSLLHIGSNMLALCIIGPPLERLLGRWRFAAVYLLAALGGSALIYLLGSPIQPVAGASGAIFGLFGAALVMARRLGLDLQWLIGIIVLNFVFTFSVADVSKLAHVGGFVTGALAGLAIGGWPGRARAIPTPTQVQGLAGVTVLVGAVVALAAATF